MQQTNHIEVHSNGNEVVTEQQEMQQQSIEVYKDECRMLQGKYMLRWRELRDLRRQLENMQQYAESLKQQYEQKELQNATLLNQLSEANSIQKDMNATIDKYSEQIHTLQGENQTLRTQQAAYTPTSWATWLIPTWRTYYCEHYLEIDQKKAVLKRGLDQESAKVIELLCQRNFELLPPIRYANRFLYRIDQIYEPWELEGMAHTEHKERFKQRHVVPKVCYLETTVSKFYNGVVFLPEKIQNKLKNSHIIDGGACWGDSMLAFSEYHPKAIHCFEPDSSNFKQLQETVALNGLEELAVLSQLGLSSGTGEAELYSSEYPSCNTINPTDVKNLGIRGEEPIHLIGIDEYVKQTHIQVGMIKLDIEGVEFDAICGAKECIIRDKPILLISIYHTPKDFFDIKPMIESWGLNYHFIIRKTTYRDLIAEVMLIGYVDEPEGGAQ